MVPPEYVVLCSDRLLTMPSPIELVTNSLLSTRLLLLWFPPPRSPDYHAMDLSTAKCYGQGCGPRVAPFTHLKVEEDAPLLLPARWPMTCHMPVWVPSNVAQASCHMPRITCSQVCPLATATFLHTQPTYYVHNKFFNFMLTFILADYHYTYIKQWYSWYNQVNWKS